MNLDINVTENSEKYLVHLSGEIDAYTSQKLKDTLLPLTKKKGYTLVVDLEQVNYMDSTGLGVFISVLKATKEAESSMTLINLKERVRKLFKITGLDQIININLDERGVND
ncbi:anti-sigma factor antagonist [Ornithinibacillus sp. L9]|uniref:Anti-sigma factor antagonist n=1 Tax=Ornithinibacillus caprae TaxID=2678566 RepID=A0A6N8FJC1_9BACI|nr:STAS domain-containing protein [Ornithinibacillus caprae]MUK89710.1 anti-sigma factor antagonist [Ornithinibacillus caprae]